MGKGIKKTLLLDQETIDILKIYGQKHTGSDNISSAIRTMAREFKSIQRLSQPSFVTNTMEF